MSKIRSKNTRPEIFFRRALWQIGLRYRIAYNSLPGKPDIYFPKAKLAIFIDGSFWHGYNWQVKKARINSNRKYWINKIEANMQRDLNNNLKLSQLGIHVLRFWDFEISSQTGRCIKAVLDKLDEHQ